MHNPCLEIFIVFGTRVEMVNRRLWSLGITIMYIFTVYFFKYKDIVQFCD